MDTCVSMFKAFDIRVKYAALSKVEIHALTRSIAKYYAINAGVESVIIARDARLYSPCLMESLVEAFLGAGLNVFVNPLQISTCQFYFMCMKHLDCGGIMVTASHNPAEYVGLKFVGQQCSPIASGYGPAGGIERIKQYYLNEDYFHLPMQRGHLKLLSMQDEFIDYSIKLAGVGKDELKGLKIFAEFLSGTGGADFLQAFDFGGADLILSNFIPDGHFPAGDPNPIIESSVAPARTKMREGSFDMGFCFDGDADRMDLMYPDGSQVLPCMNMSLLIPYIRNLFKPLGSRFRCYSDVKAAPPAVIRIAKAGMEPHIIRNGHSFIKEKLRDNFFSGFVLAEEESAHCYMNFPIDPDDFSKGCVATENTLFFSLLSAFVWMKNQSGIIELQAIQNGIHRSKEWSIHFHKTEFINQFMHDVELAMVKKGADIVRNMDDGSSLDAVLLRYGIPSTLSASSELSPVWWQVAGRVSRSEDALCRWEILACNEDTVKDLENAIREVADDYIQREIAF